jgi:hypothetical protein
MPRGPGDDEVSGIFISHDRKLDHLFRDGRGETVLKTVHFLDIDFRSCWEACAGEKRKSAKQNYKLTARIRRIGLHSFGLYSAINPSVVKTELTRSCIYWHYK